MTEGVSVCSRCGDALTGERALIPDLDICAACLEPRGERRVPRREAEGVPMWFGAALALGLVGSVVMGAIAGALAATALGSSREHAGALGGVGGLIVFAWRLGSLDGRLKSVWKRRTARRLALAHLPLERLRFAYVLRAARAGGAWLGPTDEAFVIESETALVFLGRAGRTILPLAEVEAGGWIGMRGHWWVRLELRDGSVVCISIQEGSTAWGAHEGTRAFGGRLHARLGRRPSRDPASSPSRQPTP